MAAGAASSKAPVSGAAAALSSFIYQSNSGGGGGGWGWWWEGPQLNSRGARERERRSGRLMITGEGGQEPRIFSAFLFFHVCFKSPVHAGSGTY